MNGAGPGVDPFEKDVLATGGYRYTTDAPLSSRLANQRMTEASLASADWLGKRVIDLGCGDGTYGAELLRLGEPASIHGVDPGPAAVSAAQARTGDPRMTFAVGALPASPTPMVRSTSPTCAACCTTWNGPSMPWRRRCGLRP